MYCIFFKHLEFMISRLRRIYANSLRRDWHHHKSVWFFVILMVLLRWRALPAAKSFVFSRLTVLLISAFETDNGDWTRRRFTFILVNWLLVGVIDASGLAPEIPEDLYHLIKKAVAIRKHLERNRKDKDSKFRLILVESRIHRLARYYKKTKKLPPVWK